MYRTDVTFFAQMYRSMYRTIYRTIAQMHRTHTIPYRGCAVCMRASSDKRQHVTKIVSGDQNCHIDQNENNSQTRTILISRVCPRSPSAPGRMVSER
jgi:hypothetical protein